MHRHSLAFAVFVFSCAVLSAGAQQSAPGPNTPASNQDRYEGQSNPPADDPITVSQPDQENAPKAKPSPAHRIGDSERAPAQAEQNQPAPASASSGNPSLNYPNPDEADSGVVQVAPRQESQPGRGPVLSTRKASSDPDGDIVHPSPLPAGVLAEGAVIRTRLLTHLSTVNTERDAPFRARVASDVLQDGNVLIPAGAEIDGHVVEVSSGSFGGHGSIHLRPETVTLLDGSRFHLDAQVIGTPGAKAKVNNEGTINPGSRKRKNEIEYAGAVGVGAVAGAAMGGPAGALAGSLIGAGAITVHLLMDHPQARLEPGTVLVFSLNQRLNLVAADKASSEKMPAESASSEQ